MASGEVDEALLDQALARIRTLHKVDAEHREEVNVDAHHHLAREVAADCIVLLKNQGGILPLSPEARVAVVGRHATEALYQGGGSSHVNATRVDQPLAELRAVGSSVHLIEGDDPQALARAAAGHDAAVVFVGLEESSETEGVDRGTLDMPAADVALLRAMAASGVPTVAVVSHGGVVSLEGWADDVAAILDAGLLGQGGGHALAQVIFGLVNPSGRLAETIPVRLEDNPSWLNFPGESGEVRYGEGVLVGYRYYATAGVGVRFPFGHGLSYTTFDAALADAEATGATTATVSARLTNTGQVAGKGVVQLYVSPPAGRVRRPVRQLAAFAKPDLEPGASETVTFHLDARSFAYWDTPEGRWVVDPGEYRLQLCSDALTVTDELVVRLDGNRRVPTLTLDSRLGDWLDHPVAGPALEGLVTASAPEGGPGLRAIEHLTVRTLIEWGGGAFPVDGLTALMDHANSTLPQDGIA